MRRKFTWAVGSLLSVMLALYLFELRPVLDARGLTDVYHEIELGQGVDEVQREFGRDPVLVVRFEKSVMYYYGTRYAPWWKRFMGGVARERERIAKYKASGTISLDNLPYLYDHVEILVDRSTNRLTAKSVNGEEYHVHTILGAFPGSCLKDLPPDILGSLLGAADAVGTVE